MAKKKGYTIAMAGKGGTGKTTLAGLLVRFLKEHDMTPILAVDADAISNLKTSQEGMPPLWFEKIIAPFFYPWNLRFTDRLRQLSPRQDDA